MKKIILMMTALLVLTSGSFVSAAHHAQQKESAKKAVLITGATSGIGRAAAEHIAAMGYTVYAGARKTADIEELNMIENIIAVKLDVTDQSQIDSAVKQVKSSGYQLVGLVNNAGVNVVAPMIVADVSDLDFLFQVNVYGVFRVTKAFAPLIIESKGRIINISSISGVLSGGGYGMYAASKHAIEAFTDSTDAELEEFGVHVAAVNPGNFASRIGLSRCKRLVADNTGEDWGLFEERRQQMLQSCRERLKAGVQSEGTPPDAVASTIAQALFEERPRDRYLVVPRQVEAGWTIAKAMEELLEYNIGHEHSYTRDELMQLLDAFWPYVAGDKSMDDEKDAAARREFLQAWMRKGEQKVQSEE